MNYKVFYGKDKIKIIYDKPKAAEKEVETINEKPREDSFFSKFLHLLGLD